MEQAIPSMTLLFSQLGLRSAPQDIDAFIAANRPLATGVLLADADFWTRSQADFLRCEVAEDTAWSVVIERLNATLRAPHEVRALQTVVRRSGLALGLGG